MAELIALSFRPGTSLLHRLDVRFKLILLILISLSTLKADVPALAVLTAVLIAALTHARVSLRSILKDLRYVLILLIFILIARALSTPGSPIIKFKTFVVSREGVYQGTVICWRLVIVIMTGLSFITTTRPSGIKTAIEWMLNPFPFIPAKRIAMMMSLVVRFIPVIFEQAKETAAAQRARCVENRKNPVYRLIRFGIPLMRRTFEKADHLALAMEARCYTENRTNPRLSSHKRDWIALIAVVCLCLIIIL